MKVFITPQGGGINPYVDLLLSSLKAEGLGVTLTPLGRLSLWRAVWKNGIPQLIHLQWPHGFFIGSNFFHTLFRTTLFFIQFFTLRIMNVRFIWTIHELVNFEHNWARWELMACRTLARFVDKMIVHCNAVVPDVVDAYHILPGRLCVVPHGDYAEWYPPEIDKEEARQRLNLPVQARIFLFFGHIRRYKGLDYLIRTFSATIKSDDISLVLIGKPHSPSLAQKLSSMASEDVRIRTRFEYIPEDELITYLSACDLVILPYRESLTSGAAVLAASYGRPILMPKLGCMKDFPPESVILYEPETADGLKKALECALSAPLETIGASAKNYVRQSPWSQVAAGTLAVYQSALSN